MSTRCRLHPERYCDLGQGGYGAGDINFRHQRHAGESTSGSRCLTSLVIHIPTLPEAPAGCPLASQKQGARSAAGWVCGDESVCARAGIKDFRVHDLRHTFASWLVSAGVPLAEVRDLLGHSTIEVTERYAHLAPDNHVRAVSVLDRLSRSSHADGAKGVQQVS
ncbi:MAG: site-specific integrase [Thiobacillus sp.]|nr:site-specific integrase [Thiobacillus sp.]